MDDSQKSHKSKNNAWRTKGPSAGLRPYKNRETCSSWTPQDKQFSLHQGCPFYRGLTVFKLEDTMILFGGPYHMFLNKRVIRIQHHVLGESRNCFRNLKNKYSKKKNDLKRAKR